MRATFSRTANNSPGASTLNLRGLGASRSLVLLDGRRAQPVNAALTVDINTLPAAAIARVEVISRRPQRPYGPDAMAGVVNFILKDDFEGVRINYQTGWTDASDGEESRVDALIGGNFGDGRGNAMVGIGYAERDLAYELVRATFSRPAWTTTARGANYIRTDWPNYNPVATALPSQAAVNSVMPPGRIRRGRLRSSSIRQQAPRSARPMRWLRAMTVRRRRRT